MLTPLKVQCGAALTQRTGSSHRFSQLGSSGSGPRASLAFSYPPCNAFCQLGALHVRLQAPKPGQLRRSEDRFATCTWPRRATRSASLAMVPSASQAAAKDLHRREGAALQGASTSTSRAAPSTKSACSPRCHCRKRGDAPSASGHILKTEARALCWHQTGLSPTPSLQKAGRAAQPSARVAVVQV